MTEYKHSGEGLDIHTANLFISRKDIDRSSRIPSFHIVSPLWNL